MNLDVQTLAIRALAVLWALTVHEFAHGWMAYRCGDKTAFHAGRLTLNPLSHLDPFGTLAFLFMGFGWAKPVPVNPRFFNHPRADDIKVSLAGVGANLLSAAVFATALRIFIPLGLFRLAAAPLLVELLVTATHFNLILIFFNLIPIPPLDGSHVLRELLAWEWREKYDRIMIPYGHWILLGLVFLGRDLLRLLVGLPAALLARLLLPG